MIKTYVARIRIGCENIAHPMRRFHATLVTSAIIAAFFTAACPAQSIDLTSAPQSDPASPAETPTNIAIEQASPDEGSDGPFVTPDATNTYKVLRGVKTTLMGWTVYHKPDCAFVTAGSWSLPPNPAPKHGTVAQADVAGTLADCPNYTGKFATIYYTWTDNATNGTTDTFSSTWTGHGYSGVFTHPETFNITLEACAITSKTVATQPANTHRTTLGVGEVVALTLNGGDDATKWKLEGPGTLAPAGAKATYTADDHTGVAKITATAGTCKEPHTINFTVIAPSTITQTNPTPYYLHTRGRPDIGFLSDVYVGPDTVSFYNLFKREVNVPITGTGVYTFFNGIYICNVRGVPVECLNFHLSSTVVPGYGTKVASRDCVRSGDPGEDAPFVPGTVRATIPNQWNLSDKPPVTFFSVGYSASLEADTEETLHISKVGFPTPAGNLPPATLTKTVDSPSGTAYCE